MEGNDKVALTILVSRAERKALKQLALEQDTSVSALLRRWLREHLEQDDAIKMDH